MARERNWVGRSLGGDGLAGDPAPGRGWKGMVQEGVQGPLR